MEIGINRRVRRGDLTATDDRSAYSCIRVMATLSANSVGPVHHLSQEAMGDQRNVVLTDRDVWDIVERSLDSKHFRILAWSLDPLAETNGFLGQYYYLRVTVNLDNSLKSFRFFAKTPPIVGSPQYQFLQRYNTFNKEIVVYSDLMCCMGTGNGPKWRVDCYLGKPDVIIVLEDATLDGYVTPDKYEPFDEQHCTFALKVLSRFHSRSLILDEKLRRAGKSIVDLYGHLFGEVLFVEGDDMSQRALAASAKGACALVDLVEGLNGEERTLVKDRIHRWSRKLPSLLEPSRKYRNAICHRDIWPNNIMFKHDCTGEVTGCYIIDFQFIRYCPPAVDFACFLYLTSDKATRSRHYDSFMKTYYDSLRDAMKEGEVDIDDCLPWAEFQESCVEARHLAIIYAIMNLQIMLLTSQATEEYFAGSADQLEQVLYGDKRSVLVRHQFQVAPGYRSRIAEIIHEIHDYLPDNPPDV